MELFCIRSKSESGLVEVEVCALIEAIQPADREALTRRASHAVWALELERQRLLGLRFSEGPQAALEALVAAADPHMEPLVFGGHTVHLTLYHEGCFLTYMYNPQEAECLEPLQSESTTSPSTSTEPSPDTLPGKE